MTSSDIVVGRSQGTVLVTIHGELDPPRTAHLGHLLTDLIDGQGNLSLVVDLQDARAAGGDLTSTLVDAAERARRRGGDVRLSKPPETVRHALRKRGLQVG